jgi:hypothetical protein
MHSLWQLNLMALRGERWAGVISRPDAVAAAEITGS